MNAPHEPLAAQEAIVFRLNGEDVTAIPGETIIQAADRLGVSIPRLCYKPGYRADGNCRACMVEIKGERVLAPTPADNADPHRGQSRRCTNWVRPGPVPTRRIGTPTWASRKASPAPTAAAARRRQRR